MTSTLNFFFNITVEPKKKTPSTTTKLIPPPSQYTLMKDPVILPSSRVSVDRPVIQRHLLSDSVRNAFQPWNSFFFSYFPGPFFFMFLFSIFGNFFFFRATPSIDLISLKTCWSPTPSSRRGLQTSSWPSRWSGITEDWSGRWKGPPRNLSPWWRTEKSSLE